MRFGVIPVAVVAFLLVLAWAALGGARLSPRHSLGPSPPVGGAEGFEEVRRFSAPEANQGVAVSDTHFYGIGNRVITKYDRRDGSRVAEWREEPDGPIVHLNSCSIEREGLVCAHSNYPGLPMLSSIEIWNPDTLEHIQSRSLGFADGSLTWAVRHAGDWWLGFAHYGTIGGDPDKGPEWSRVARFDDEWREIASYAYPPSLIDRLRPYSGSGGNWGADGRLYVTGHDEPEVYVLTVPRMGAVLEWTETLPVPMHGQAWAFDPTDPNTVWGIIRGTGEIVVGSRSP